MQGNITQRDCLDTATAQICIWLYSIVANYVNSFSRCCIKLKLLKEQSNTAQQFTNRKIQKQVCRDNKTHYSNIIYIIMKEFIVKYNIVP